MLGRAIRHNKSASLIRPLVNSIIFLLCPSKSSSSVILDDPTLHHEIIWRHVNNSFLSPTRFSPSGLGTLEV